MTSEELAERLINFAARIGKVVATLSQTREWVDISPDSWFVVVRHQRLTMKKHVPLRVATTLRTN